MPESVAESASSAGPSLETLLWRAVDRWTEDPGLVDSDEFAERIALAFNGDSAAEDWVDRFFRGEDALHAPPSDMAEAVVKATRSRLHVYEFDLNRLEYVIIEDDDKVVIVSDFGQFALPNEDHVTRAIERAIIPSNTPDSPVRSDGSLKRDDANPRAFFVRGNGEVVAIDVKKVSRSLEQFFVKQVTTPIVRDPGSRLAPFAPTRRALSEAREERLLRTDPRMRRAVENLPPRLRPLLGGEGANAEAAAARYNAPPAGAEQAIFLLMPDGTLARPNIGSATRWQEMVSDWVTRASDANYSLGGGGASIGAPSTVISQGGTAVVTRGGVATVPVSSENRFMVQAGSIVALFNGSERSLPGAMGQRALTQGEAMQMVRGDNAPIRMLGDDELARAVSSGAMIVPGLALQGAGGVDRFWIQPEIAFAAPEKHQQVLQLASEPRGGGTLVQGQQPTVMVEGQPIQLGQITGDPWADWALTGGGEQPAAALALASRNRPQGALAAALDRAQASGDAPPPGLAAKLGFPTGELRLAGAPVIGFRAPDGTIVLQQAQGSAIRLAGVGRNNGIFKSVDGASGDAVGFGQVGSIGASSRQPIGVRTGALPAAAFEALRSALEQTARAGGYKLPATRFQSAFDAFETGNALSAGMDSDDPRRSSVRLAGGVSVFQSPSSQIAQMVVSMPFPNSGEVHVGSDLSEALQAYLAAPVVPSGSGMGWSSGTGLALGAGGAAAGGLFSGLGGAAGGAGAGAAGAVGPGGVAFRMGPGGAAGQSLVVGNAAGGGLSDQQFDWLASHGGAQRSAQQALITLSNPDVAPLLAQQGGSFSGLPSLLRSALAQGGDWTPGPGAVMPAALREMALRGRYDMPELVEGAPISSADTQPIQPRSLNAGEDEIVIPMPLWAQMGRGRISATEQVMASPMASRGYTPPLGYYTLVAPSSGPMDFTNGQGGPQTQLAGPTGIELAISGGLGRGVQAGSPSGRHILANVALADGGSSDSAPRRGRMMAPLDASEARAKIAAAREQQLASFRSPSTGELVTGSMPSSGPSAENIVAGADRGFTSGSNTVVASANGSIPRIDLPSPGSLPSWGGVSAGASSSGAGQPMAGALNSALQMSDAVSGRNLPGRPSLGGSFGGGSYSAGGADYSGFASRAASAGRSDGISSLSSLGGGSQTLVTGDMGTLRSELSQGAGEMSRSASEAQSAYYGSSSGSSGSSGMGLAPGTWSGHSRSTPGFQTWSYAGNRSSAPITAGNIDLSGLSRPQYPSLPTSLRFRYAGAPLWWSGSTRSWNGNRTIGPDVDVDESDSGVASRAMRSGLRAATSAASIWKSILVSGGGSSPSEDATGGMDQGRDASADDMSSLGRKLDALGSASLVSGGSGGLGAVGGKGADSVYIAMSKSGAAGAASGSALQRSRADSLELSIIAAIPPQPPPLESSGGMTGGDAPHARGKGAGGHGGGGHAAKGKEGEDQVSHSKIEGSVDAIAQRIYHRIRRRIQSDRERFGG